ncbi:MAG: type II toxin-antitoxin system prevent-host-death family antitoxin [Salinisphaera sp.]|nr:type II toxin-antitoxin system prevent-host-death family antitoxin [Salinisphaera sp.]
MPTTYSTYEAKARLSEILRKVRAGQTIFISHRGREVAEVRPFEPQGSAAHAVGLLEDRGLLHGGERKARLAPICRRPGALARFLEERE